MAKKRKGKKKKKSVVAKKIVGVMHSGSETNMDHKDPFDAFERALKRSGWDNTKVKVLDPRYAEDDLNKLAAIAGDLIAKEKVDVLVAAGGTASAQAAEKATETSKTNVVFTSVREVIRYPDNMTGVCAKTSALDPDRLELLRLMPNTNEIGVLVNSKRPSFDTEWLTLQARASQIKTKLSQQDVPSTTTAVQVEAAIKAAFVNFNNAGIQFVLVSADPFFNNHRKWIVDAAKANDIGVMCQWREFAKAGALMSYGTRLPKAYRVAGNLVGRILGGDKPKDLPIVKLSEEFVINLKTADDIGVSIPPTLDALADDTIPASKKK
jgi:putative ABC transport system substrate-binding protein